MFAFGTSSFLAPSRKNDRLEFFICTRHRNERDDDGIDVMDTLKRSPNKRQSRVKRSIKALVKN